MSSQDSSNKSSPGYGSKSHNSVVDMDKVQPLSNDEKAFDAVYFNGSNRIGWYLVLGFARRTDHVESIFILKVPGVGVLLFPKIPDTNLPHCPDDAGLYTSAGLEITPLEPMRSWHILYNGKMKLVNGSQKKVDVHLDATWESDLPFFNYDTDILSHNAAKALSLENWTEVYFKGIQKFHQTHYEQFGELTGNLTIDEIGFNLNLSSMRDHSFGIRREWKMFHRYVMHIISLADGRRINAGIACVPTMFTRMEFGYMYQKDGSVIGVGDIDFDLYQNGEAGNPPNDYGFTFSAGNEIFEVKVTVEENIEAFYGSEWEARIVESLSRFTVNGVEGWGVVEWMYSRAGGCTQQTH